MGDRIVVFNNGVIQQVDTPENIYNNPANTFVAGFIGAPQMNFIDGNLLGLGDYIVGVRPEKMISGGEIKLTVDVDMTELLGSEKIAYFNVGDKKCSAKLDADFQLGKTLDLSINREDVYLFDKQTGNRAE